MRLFHCLKFMWKLPSSKYYFNKLLSELKRQASSEQKNMKLNALGQTWNRFDLHFRGSDTKRNNENQMNIFAQYAKWYWCFNGKPFMNPLNFNKFTKGWNILLRIQELKIQNFHSEIEWEKKRFLHKHIFY